eukprot:Tbor_TRINITY_DN5746_c0_g2::TRINITY_DN5746_c0_g2_i1::g.20052::m.20052
MSKEASNKDCFGDNEIQSDDLDTLYIEALTLSLSCLSTSDNPNERNIVFDVISESCNELKSILCFAPRLYSFSHRPLLSLSCPYMSYITWYHKVNTHPSSSWGVSSSPVNNTRANSPNISDFTKSPVAFRSTESSQPDQVDHRLAAVDITGTVDGARRFVETAERWRKVALLYDKLLTRVDKKKEDDNTPDIDIVDTEEKHNILSMKPSLLYLCRDRIESDEGIQYVLQQYWRMLVPPQRSNQQKKLRQISDISSDSTDENEVSQSGRSSQMSSLGEIEASPENNFLGETLSATGYCYLKSRLYCILYHPKALLDCTDFLVRDLAIDDAVLGRSFGVIICHPTSLLDNITCVSSVNHVSSGTMMTNVNRDKSGITQSVSGNHHALMSPIRGWVKKERGADLHTLPSLTFVKFKASMLELVDNWTGTIHPHEWRALLWHLFYKVFTTDNTDGSKKAKTKRSGK